MPVLCYPLLVVSILCIEFLHWIYTRIVTPLMADEKSYFLATGISNLHSFTYDLTKVVVI